MKILTFSNPKTKYIYRKSSENIIWNCTELLQGKENFIDSESENEMLIKKKSSYCKVWEIFTKIQSELYLHSFQIVLKDGGQ